MRVVVKSGQWLLANNSLADLDLLIYESVDGEEVLQSNLQYTFSIEEDNEINRQISEQLLENPELIEQWEEEPEHIKNNRKWLFADADSKARVKQVLNFFMQPEIMAKAELDEDYAKRRKKALQDWMSIPEQEGYPFNIEYPEHDEDNPW